MAVERKGREVERFNLPSNLPSINLDNHRISEPVFVIWEVKSQMTI